MVGVGVGGIGVSVAVADGVGVFWGVLVIKLKLVGLGVFVAKIWSRGVSGEAAADRPLTSASMMSEIVASLVSMIPHTDMGPNSRRLAAQQRIKGLAPRQAAGR